MKRPLTVLRASSYDLSITSKDNLRNSADPSSSSTARSISLLGTINNYPESRIDIA